MEITLIKKGAEANLYRTDFQGWPAVLKRRIPKKYRLETLDFQLRRFRTVHEAQMIHQARTYGVPTPIIYYIDIPNTSIMMSYVEGPRLKEILERTSKSTRRRILEFVGSCIGRLHNASTIHGDLTTTNMIKTQIESVAFIDFGLSFHSNQIEDRGEDIHLLKTILESTHHKISDECLVNVMHGYSKAVGKKNALIVSRKVRDIERRGRYNVGRQA